MGWKEERDAWKKKLLGQKDPPGEGPVEPGPVDKPPAPRPIAESEAVPPLLDEPKPEPPTSPWNAPSSPWKRDTLRVIKKRPGFRMRWVDPRNFERNLENGFTFARTEHYGGVYDQIAGEETPIDSHIRRRGMVLMEIPEELAKKREEYYAARADMAERSIRERHKKEANESGVEVYDPVK
ncbi:hypothetical protein EPN95_04520 [Patescibacteria group bacterium]|nr:MAG: hypothetical protein EPN95_04520 [Patescibacteria group bacterium]